MQSTKHCLSLRIVWLACWLGTVLLAVPAQAKPFAYVTNGGSNTVSVIDTGSNTVVATIAVGALPRGVAITPDGTRAYVPNAGSTVSVIDTATNTAVASISVGANPQVVAITPDGTRAYVTNSTIPGMVSIIDTATNTVVATVAVGPQPSAVAITPDGTRAYVTNGLDNTVSVIDIATNTVVATIAVGLFPEGVAITPVPQVPKSKEECKHGGYLKFGPPAGPFKNQGQCVSFVNTGK